MHVVGHVLALVLSLSNLVYRLNEDLARAVMPAGISLTAIAVCLLLLTARLNRDIAVVDPHDDLIEPDLIWEDGGALAHPSGPTHLAPFVDPTAIWEPPEVAAAAAGATDAASDPDPALISGQATAPALPAPLPGGTCAPDPVAAPVQESARHRGSSASRPRMRKVESPAPAPPAAVRARSAAKKRPAPRPRSASEC